MVSYFGDNISSVFNFFVSIRLESVCVQTFTNVAEFNTLRAVLQPRRDVAEVANENSHSMMIMVIFVFA